MESSRYEDDSGAIPKIFSACWRIRIGSLSPDRATSIIFLATSSVIGS